MLATYLLKVTELLAASCWLKTAPGVTESGQNAQHGDVMMLCKYNESWRQDSEGMLIISAVLTSVSLSIENAPTYRRYQKNKKSKRLRCFQKILKQLFIHKQI